MKSKVLALNEVAMHLRKRREANGSLRLDQPKLKFALDDDTKLPFGVTIYEVVQELMAMNSSFVSEKRL